jgi:hypothetical protein
MDLVTRFLTWAPCAYTSSNLLDTHDILSLLPNLFDRNLVLNQERGCESWIESLDLHRPMARHSSVKSSVGYKRLLLTKRCDFEKD